MADLFSNIGFEAGNLDELTSTSVGSGNGQAAATAAALHGTYGDRLTFGGTVAQNYGEKTFSSASEVFVRCYFRGNSFALGANYNETRPLQILSGTNSLVAIHIQRVSASSYTFYRMYYRTNSGTGYVEISSQTFSNATTYLLELRFVSGNGNGIAQARIGESQIASITNLTNNNYTADRMRIGSDYHAPSSGSEQYYDDLLASDSAWCGAYSAPSSDVYSGRGVGRGIGRGIYRFAKNNFGLYIPRYAL